MSQSRHSSITKWRRPSPAAPFHRVQEINRTLFIFPLRLAVFRSTSAGSLQELTAAAIADVTGFGRRSGRHPCHAGRYPYNHLPARRIDLIFGQGIHRKPVAEEHAMPGTGKITQVIGSTFDAEFPEDQLPLIYNALKINSDQDGHKIDLV